MTCQDWLISPEMSWKQVQNAKKTGRPLLNQSKVGQIFNVIFSRLFSDEMYIECISKVFHLKAKDLLKLLSSYEKKSQLSSSKDRDFNGLSLYILGYFTHRPFNLPFLISDEPKTPASVPVRLKNRDQK